MKKVTDPQSMRATEIPRSSDANPAGVIWAPAVERLAGDSGMSGGERRRLKTRADSSQNTLDCWSSGPLMVFIFDKKKLRELEKKNAIIRRNWDSDLIEMKNGIYRKEGEEK